MSACSKAACYAVLASLSERYPPLEGRSPTRYSPVCHSTHPLRGFRVRLACVRHAASVDSEPGSNSHVKAVGPRRLVLSALSRADGLALGTQPFNARPIRLCVVQSVLCSQSLPPAECRTDAFGRAIPQRCALTLVINEAVCACTHYPVFKEPTYLRPPAHRCDAPARL